MNCPVCEKSGIPDFTREPIVCSQCDSDLKAFMLLNQLEVEVNQPTVVQISDKDLAKPRSSYWKWITAAILVGVLAGRYLWPTTNDSEQRTIVKLRDSLITMQRSSTKLASNPSVTQPATSTSERLYVVQKGDYLEKIAQLFYKNSKYYKDIAQNNGIQNVNKIKTGDTLKIK